jgi:hypothetical protein
VSQSDGSIINHVIDESTLTRFSMTQYGTLAAVYSAKLSVAYLGDREKMHVSLEEVECCLLT